jgi:hypothetical protein
MRYDSGLLMSALTFEWSICVNIESRVFMMRNIDWIYLFVV